jgi:hypothetical protein
MRFLWLLILLPSLALAGNYYCVDMTQDPPVLHAEHATRTACVGGGYSWKFNVDSDANGYYDVEQGGWNLNPATNPTGARTLIGAAAALGNPAADNYVLRSTAAGVRSWAPGGGGGAVDSVNSQTGAVVLDADDIDETATREYVTGAQKTEWSGKQDALGFTPEPADGTILKESELSSATDSTSITTPANSAAVKSAYDLAAGKQSPATTLAGYGITDAATDAQGVKADNAQALLDLLLSADHVVVLHPYGAGCDTGHASYNTIRQALIDVGYDDDHVLCADGMDPLTPSITAAITGVEGSGEIGTLAITGQRNITLSLSGVEGTGEIGTIVVLTGGVVNGTASITGVEGSGELGSIGITIQQDGSVTIAGVEGTGEIGTVAATASGGGVTRSDNFDGTGALSANWTTGAGALAISRNTGFAVTGGQTAVAIWTGDTFSDDQHSEIVLTPAVDFDQSQGVVIRASGATLYSDPTSGATTDMYRFTYAEEEENGTYITLQVVDNGTATIIAGTLGSQPYIANLSHLRISASGTVVKAEYRVSSGAWQTHYNNTPATSLSTGQVGIILAGTEKTNAWTGGDGAGTP